MMFGSLLGKGKVGGRWVQHWTGYHEDDLEAFGTDKEGRTAAAKEREGRAARTKRTRKKRRKGKLLMGRKTTTRRRTTADTRRGKKRKGKMEGANRIALGLV